MILTKPPSAPECARDLAVCTSYLHGPTPLQDTLAAVQAAAGDPARGLHSPRSASQPAFVLADAGNWSYVFIEGTSSLTQGALCLTGYSGDPLSSLVAPRNGYFDEVASNVLAAAASGGLLSRPNIMCVGHSMGGAIAELIAGRVKDTVRIANVNYCSFGSPKPASWPALASVNQCVAARWFGADDPVPLLIPSSNDNVAMLLAFSVRENIRFTAFAQPYGGLELSAIGNVSPASVPSRASVDSITNIAAWLYSLDTEAGQAHALATYIARLTNNLVNNPDGADRPTEADRTNQAATATRRELTEANRVALARLQEQERLQHVPRVNIPDQYKAVVVRVGRVWNVTVNDQVVAMTVRERTARSAARKYNAWIDSVLTQGIVDPVSLSNAVRDYLKNAEDPGSEITPQLQTRLAPKNG